MADGKTALGVPALDRASAAAKVQSDALPAVETNRCGDKGRCVGTHFDTSSVQMEATSRCAVVPCLIRGTKSKEAGALGKWCSDTSERFVAHGTKSMV